MFSLTEKKILSLYKSHQNDLKHLRSQAKIHLKKNKVNTMLDDLEAEITYLLLRNYKPKVTVEISPYEGWSTIWLLNALKNNGYGKLYSYDLVDTSQKFVPQKLAQDRWQFFKGDVKKLADKIPGSIDCLFIDSEHTRSFADWYIKNVFPRLKKNALVMIHDIFHYPEEPWQFSEKPTILSWLKSQNINYITATPVTAKGILLYQNLIGLRESLNIRKKITDHNCNPMIFFIYKKGGSDKYFNLKGLLNSLRFRL
ncbi:hypothetical protein A2767_07670 [Candidatus Roizmanbacteria bacterium RIFCSPHIGHO2_01_FULL_35_10]|uniref:Class I SAM-dependent methyltransferase n=1 Tax=Candidatus Roizmanbacteria bacterium RIFCSPLOWO2_01_FULL_35_13 TaxID=1802055 RepID=A0A1F7ICQ6_9BACT|nr:MAG: hypothetical protein A2767_07670 [Candidatus Roizmanbacteria bacterium RIFCSPHIGHO2_01_FULL_35_10]OGK41144.1 MAG: hypothetical protein A3A74_02265 [Candidatus Roizmanbacteria bacterium RIFCSPLOWO2_01_FULL_35_13]